jgi:hypothetical protein
LADSDTFFAHWLKGNITMASRLKMNRLPSLFLIIPMLLLAILGACSKSKKTGVDAAGSAPIQSSSDASADAAVDSEDASTALEDCKKNDDDEDEEEEAEDDESDESDTAPKGKGKGKENKGNKIKKNCPVPTAGNGEAAPATGTASLAEGQKIYAANCQGCHGALPGEEQGASAQSILGAANLGVHKGIAPWPVAQASTLSPQDAAASLAEAMK